MTLNSYFNFYGANNEQSLLSDLIVESIQFYGQDMAYLPRRESANADDLFGQDDMGYFDTVYTVEMYIKSTDGFEGDGNFLSKFGLEVRDQVALSVARTRFIAEVGDNETDYDRPREGDLIYFPMTLKLFEIVFVDKREQFYPMGTLPLFDIKCDVFEFNGERFNTGNTVIDAIASSVLLDTTAEDDLVQTTQDAEFDNDFLHDAANSYIDFTIVDPFSDGNY